MKFKFVVNGKEYVWTILYGRTVLIAYEAIAGMAGFNSAFPPTITYKLGKKEGILNPGKRIDVPLDQVPVFNVADTSNA